MQSSAKPTYDAAKDVFVGDSVSILKLAMAAIQSCGHKIDNANESLGFISFSTGMTWNSFAGAACTIALSESGVGQYKVSGSGKQKAHGLFRISLDLTGETNRIASKVIDEMKKLSMS